MLHLWAPRLLLKFMIYLIGQRNLGKASCFLLMRPMLSFASKLEFKMHFEAISNYVKYYHAAG